MFHCQALVTIRLCYITFRMTTVNQIYIGTSGWSYPKGEGTWNGYFYPPGTKNELGFYSEFFNAVEINSSFYAPINPVYAQNWVKKTPPNFKFTAKLWQKFTHPAMFESNTGAIAAISSEDVRLFISGIEPLAQSGKLGAILAQFPPSFEENSANKRVIQAVINTFGEYPLAVELRHKSWSDTPGTSQLLSEQNVAWVQIDEPKFRLSISQDLPNTSDIGYFRFHGRNAKDWWTGNNETKYRYFYSENEVLDLAGRVKDISGKTKRVFAFFNNHWQAYAPRNAGDLRKAMQLPFPDFRDQMLPKRE